MTDADLIDRAAAFDAQGRLIAWTPEAVQLRMVEGARVISSIPMRIWPKGAQGFWPHVLIVAQDLIDKDRQERNLASPSFDGDWDKVLKQDTATMARLSEQKQAEWSRPAPPSAAELSRAEEALRWPAIYLADRPLLADALTLWAFCIGTGESLRATLRKRVKDADAKMRAVRASKRQDAVPNQNFDRRLVTERRRIAASIISDGLRASKTLLRMPAEAPWTAPLT